MPSSSGERRSTSRSLRRSRRTRLTRRASRRLRAVVLVHRAGRRRACPRRSAATRSATRSISSRFCVDEHDRAAGVPQRRGPLPQPPPLLGVERGSRLVEQEHVRRAEQRDREVRGAGGCRRRGSRWEPPSPGSSKSAEQALGRGARVVLALEPREELEVLPRGEPAVVRRPLRRPPDAHALAPLDRPALGSSAPARSASSVDLPAPFGPDERDRVAVPDLELDAARARRVRRTCGRRLGRRGAARAASTAGRGRRIGRRHR